MTNVLIAGYYGAGNAGDEWILSGMLAGLRQRDPAVCARVLSFRPEVTELQHEVEALGWGDIEALTESIRHCDLVIIGGGGLWQDYWGFDRMALLSGRPGGIAGYGTPIMLAHLLGRPCAVIGVGVGPLRDLASREAMSGLAELAGFISVRDPGSREDLADCGVDPERIHLGADLCLLAEPPAASGPRSSSGPVLAVNLRPWAFAGDPAHWEREIAAALRLWCSEYDGQVVFVPLHETEELANDDRVISLRVADAIAMGDQVRIIPAVLTDTERLLVLASTDLVLGMRYHSLMAGARAGVPCVALAYDPKIRRLMADLDAEALLLALPDLDGRQLADHLSSALGAPSIPADRLEGLRIRATQAVQQALRESGGGMAKPSPLVSEFVVGQSLYLSRLERAMGEGFGLPLSPSPRVEAGLSNFEEGLRQARRTEGELSRTRAELVRVRSVLGDAEGQLQASFALATRTQLALETERARAADILTQLTGLRATAGVRLLDRYWRVVRRLAPEGGRTRVLYQRLRMAVRTFVPGGTGAPQLTTYGSSASRRQWLAGRRNELADDEAWFQRLGKFIDSPRNEAERGTVFILAPTRYEGNEGQRSYHLARELSRRGRKVVFGYWRWHAEGVDMSGRTDAEVLAMPLDVLLSDPDRSLAADAGRPRWVLLEFPFPGAHRFLATANARGYLTVYDAVDDWEAFHRVGQAPWFDRDFERALGTVCDTVLAVSPGLQAIVASRCRQRVHLVPNACAPDIMLDLTSVVVERGVITAGYFGHLTESWFDWDLLLECARRRPDWRFHLIGYGGGWRTTRLPLNVHYHGQLPRSRLASHAAAWDVGIIPFRRGPVAAAADPIKAYEYLALDLPVAASGIVPSPESEGLIHIGDNAEAFVRAVQHAVARRIDDRTERRAFAFANTWARRVDKIEQLLAADDPRAAFKSRLFEALA